MSAQAELLAAKEKQALAAGAAERALGEARRALDALRSGAEEARAARASHWAGPRRIRWAEAREGRPALSIHARDSAVRSGGRRGREGRSGAKADDHVRWARERESSRQQPAPPTRACKAREGRGRREGQGGGGAPGW